MKQLLLTAFILATAPTIMAQNEPADTVKIIENASKVIITRQAQNTSIKATIPDESGKSFKTYSYTVTVKEYADSSRETISENIFAGLPFLNSKKKEQTDSSANTRFKRQRYITGIRNIYWGWNFAYDGKAGIKNSFEVGVAELVAVNWKPWRNGPDFRVGLGFGMKRFLAGENMVFYKNHDCLTLEPIATEAYDVKSRWDVWTIHLPLMASQQIYKDFGIAFGAMVNFNTYSKAWSQFEIDDIRYHETYKGLQQQLLTIELVGIIGLREGIGFYAKWNPVPLMASHFGPSFKTWSMGISLNF